MKANNERAEFEAAMDGLLFDRADDGTYTSSVTRVALEAYQAGRAALQSQPTNRWYAIDNTGLATLCADKQDAIDTASEAAQLYPQRAPYVVAQMVPADADMQSQDREDAERYRWLRSAGKETERIVEDMYECALSGEDLDAAIDHARRTEGDGE